ncbi:MAG: beta-ketoacyl-ACP synthase II [Gammaproteobacteria bacterium]|nr:beta-ketoacyl-ACP synthase II [Gammaproteobacteria bacterium]MDH5239847.1 beta-ketoacyl-ACP synthase II [Gammaproteobacteria bacterium]MDH5260755.1 beta-ketoacyl-ACP synthase II [Gammaproteobacteria bacterium]MDH5583191.1 beta-ketoacyl-ACP synthase II [Gammaproteobacteria bacterium]
MSKRRVVITGMGIISPVGSKLEEAWSNVCEGVSGTRLIDEFDTSSYPTRIAGIVKGFDVDAYLSPKDQRKNDPFIHYGIAATVDAIADSGIEITEENGHTIGIAMGAGIGGIKSIADNHSRMLEGGPRKVSPFFIPGSIINMTSGLASIMQHITGPNVSIVTACATSTHCIGIASRMIEHGDAEVMLAGGSEYATTPLAMGGFCSAKAMSTRNDDPAGASRPYDIDRDGFVLSNGAGCVVLEELEHARARGARIYAEVIGFGMSGDAYHITLPPADGEGARKCMTAAIRDAGIDAADIDYLNAHGTSTPAGDIGETHGIKRAFGAAANTLAVSSTKSTTGHLLGAAGAVEAIFCALAIRDQVIPPTINLENQDPACDLDYTPNVARDAKVRTAISNSFGFGGTNGSLILRALD